MLEVEQIRELAEYQAQEGNVLSAYLNTDRATDPGRDQGAYLSALLRSAIKRGAAESDVAKVRHFFDRDFTGQARSVAVFSHAATGFWSVHELQLPLPDLVVAERSPYVLPLLRLTEDSERQCIVLLSKERARIFYLYVGELEEIGEITNERLHGRQKQGGWAQSRMQRHHGWGVRRHFKDVSEVLLAVFLQREFDRLIVGIPSPELEPLFVRSLHPWLAERIGAWFDMAMYENDAEIKREIIEIQGHLEEEQERQLLQELRENLGPGQRGVAGPDDTLFELQRGALDVLIVRNGIQLPGRRCAACEYFDALQEEAACPLCEGDFVQVPELMSDVIKAAFDRNVRVRFMQEDDYLESIGNIGGLLRYRPARRESA
ncbi:MAG: baeRF10 domain-containing protein [Candidatus Geothermincolia bacterium]